MEIIFSFLPPVATAVKISDIRLAGDGDFGGFVFLLVAGRSSSPDGQNSGDNKLETSIKLS
jgi:hypothetical protein